MKERLKISAVSYLNTSPYIAGLRSVPNIEERFDIKMDTPAECAARLLNGKADLGVVPVASIHTLPAHRPITKWGIVGDGAVESVLLVSEVPVEETRFVYLDYQSNTSNSLLRILLQEYLNLEVQFVRSQPGYEQNIRATTGGLLIGDRALHLGQHFTYKYDLSRMWKEWTGLPFVFARWVGNDRVTNETLDYLDELFEAGLEKREEIAATVGKKYPDVDILHYLTNSIVYRVSDEACEGERLFLKKLGVESEVQEVG